LRGKTHATVPAGLAKISAKETAMKRRLVLKSGTGAAIACALPSAWAQAFPNRPIQIVSAFPPGSGTDFVARLVGERLAAALGQPVVVSNRPGAGGTIAAAFVASSPPDGHTLLANSSAHTLYPSLYPDVKVDVTRETIGVAGLTEIDQVLVTAPSRGWRTLQDFLAFARSAPQPVTFSSGGHGTASHMGFERLASAAQLKRLHIPFKGTPEAVTEVAAGRVDVTYGNMSSALALLNANQLVALSISGRRRSAVLPDVPTSLEAGIADSDYTAWNGLFAPGATPRPIVERLNQEVVKALAVADVNDRLRKASQVPVAMSVDQFNAQLRAEYANNAALVKAANIKIG